MYQDYQKGKTTVQKEVSDKLKRIRQMLADRTRRKKVLDEIRRKWL